MATNERDERKAGFIQSATTEPDNGDPPTPTIRPGQSKQPKRRQRSTKLVAIPTVWERGRLGTRPQSAPHGNLR
jgi:hypothetical protein